MRKANSTKSAAQTTTSEQNLATVMKIVATVFDKINDEKELATFANALCTEIKTTYDLRRGAIKAAQAIAAEKKLTAAQKQQLEALNTCYNMGLITDKEYADKYQMTTGMPYNSGNDEAEDEIEKKQPVKKAQQPKSAPKTKTVSKAKVDDVKQVKISSLTKADIKKMGIKFEQYSEKCMFLTGETKAIKDEIKSIGGAHWNSARKGWFVKNDKAEVLAKALKIKLA